MHPILRLRVGGTLEVRREEHLEKPCVMVGQSHVSWSQQISRESRTSLLLGELQGTERHGQYWLAALQWDNCVLMMCKWLTSSSAMAERPCDVGNLKGGVNLRLNFRLKGCVSRQYLRTVRCGNGYSTTLLLEVFTQRLCSRLYSTKIEFYLKKQKNCLLSHLLRIQELLHTPSIAHWKGFGRLPIHHN